MFKKKSLKTKISDYVLQQVESLKANLKTSSPYYIAYRSAMLLEMIATTDIDLGSKYEETETFLLKISWEYTDKYISKIPD